MAPLGQAVPVHRLRPNDTEWSPPTVICFDTETTPIEGGDREVLALRLWAAVAVDRRPLRGGRQETVWGRGTTREELAAWVTARCRGRRTVWGYAHNLGFDLTVTRLADLLVEAGWRLGDFAFSARSTWLRLSRGDTTLTLCDSHTWFPISLEGVAATGSEAKVPLPADDDPDGQWWARCESDVRILAEAILAVMAWWDTEHLGRWTITGSASGWNAFRHRMRRGALLIDVTPELVARDRQAIRGGRREVTRVGVLEGGPWVQIDFESAYPTVAAHLPLPHRRRHTFTSLPLDSTLLDNTYAGVIAEVEVECTRPRWPLRFEGQTFYPTGRFRTVLAGPEIAWARELGELRAVGAGQVHELSGVMAGWARWVLATAAGEDPAAPPVARLVAKAWGRSVIGKTAAHTSSQRRLGPSLAVGWGWTPGWDAPAGARAVMLDALGDRWWVTSDQDPDNCYPAILAFVESHVRVRLGRMLDALGEGRWVQCDTDGLMLHVAECLELAAVGVRFAGKPRDGVGAAAAVCDWLAPLTWPLVPRPKAAYDSLEVLGPQHLFAGSEARLSGVRRDARRGPDGRFTGRRWPGIAWQMAHGDRRGYVRPLGSWTLPATTAHRWVLEDGRAVPVEARIDPDGVSRLVPWGEGSWAGRGVVPVREQIAGLRGLI